MAFGSRKESVPTPLVWLVLWLCAVAPAGAQEGVADSLLACYEQRFCQLDSLILLPQTTTADTTAWQSLRLEAEADAAQMADTLIARKVEAQIGALRARTGLQLAGQTYYRPDAQLGLDDEEAVSRYSGKIQAEVRWYYFQSALFRRQGQERELQIKGEMERVAQEKERTGLLRARQEALFQHRYDSLLSVVLTHRIANLDLLYTTHHYLLAHQDISSDGMLAVMDDKARAERQLHAIPDSARAQGRELPSTVAMLVELQRERLMQEVSRQASDLSLLELQAALLEQQELNTTYLSEVKAAPFVRYSHYFRPELAGSNNVDLGLTFQIPLSGETSRRRRALQAEREQVLESRTRVQAQVLEEAALVADDVERNNRLMASEMDRLEQLRAYLAMRSRAYDHRRGEYSRLSRMHEYNAYLSCLENLLRYQHVRDSRLAQLQSFLGLIPIQDFCSVKFRTY